MSVFDLADQSFVDSVDETPLWSAPFGLALLRAVRLAPGLRVLDVGCGTGFPILELSGRLGPSSTLVGLDPWRAGLGRCSTKAVRRRLGNVRLVEAVAEDMPFAAASFDLVISNNGLNNVTDLDRSLASCARVMRLGGQMVVTFNLPESMAEFYSVFEATLIEQGLSEVVPELRAHIHAKRRTVDEFSACLDRAGFDVCAVQREAFAYRYLNGTTMLSSFLIQLAFADAWRALLPPGRAEGVFSWVAATLDGLAAEQGALTLTIPFACLDCRRRGAGAL